MHTIFFDQNNTLRSGWRAVIFILLFVPSAGIAGAALQLFFGWLRNVTPVSPVVAMGANGVSSLAIALILGWLCGKYFEGLKFRALGASLKDRWARNLMIGIAVGAVTFAIAAGSGAILGRLSFSWNGQATAISILSTLLISFLVFAAAAAFEEAVFRGYILQTFVRSDLTLFGILLTSILFASVHNANPAANLYSWANTLLAGIWFGVGYLKTRDLWFPTGLHLAWNWTQGSIFGVEVSGLTDIVKHPLMRENDLGPVWLTGGDYGIEGGIACTIALVVSTIAIWLWPRSRDLDLE